MTKKSSEFSQSAQSKIKQERKPEVIGCQGGEQPMEHSNTDRVCQLSVLQLTKEVTGAKNKV